MTGGSGGYFDRYSTPGTGEYCWVVSPTSTAHAPEPQVAKPLGAGGLRLRAAAHGAFLIFIFHLGRSSQVVSHGLPTPQNFGATGLASRFGKTGATERPSRPKK